MEKFPLFGGEINEIPFAKELKLEPAAIEWIGEVKKQSDLEMSVEPTRRMMGALMSGYDLIDLHLRILKDLKVYGNVEHVLSHSTEKKLNEIISYILERELRFERNYNEKLYEIIPLVEARIQETSSLLAQTKPDSQFYKAGINEINCLQAIVRLAHAKTDAEKMTALTLLLNTWHFANRGMRKHFIGIPKREGRVGMYGDLENVEFLEKLNNIDNKSFWENQKKEKF